MAFKNSIGAASGSRVLEETQNSSFFLTIKKFNKSLLFVLATVWSANAYSVEDNSIDLKENSLVTADAYLVWVNMPEDWNYMNNLPVGWEYVNYDWQSYYVVNVWSNEFDFYIIPKNEPFPNWYPEWSFNLEVSWVNYSFTLKDDYNEECLY